MTSTLLIYNDQETVNVFLNDILLSKNLSGNWAQGNGGGLDTGTWAASATYHVHVIEKISDGTLDALLSGSPLNPVVPSGWQLTGQVAGAVVTNSGTQIIPFFQFGKEFRYVTALYISGANNVPTLRNLPIAVGCPMQAIILPAYTGAAGAWCFALNADFGVLTIGAAPSTAGYVGFRTGAAAFAQTLLIWTNSTGQIYTGDDDAAAQLTIIVHGWIDPRVIPHV